jgi:putative ATP-dependent endonuclease of OLD family
VNVLAQKADHAEVYQPAAGLDDAAAQRVERYLDAVRSTLLFARGVLLVEGTAELILLPSLMRAVFGILPDEMGLSVVSMESAFFEHVAAIFHDDRVRRRCSIITDYDQPYIDLADCPDDDDNEQRHARAAADAGQKRRDALEGFCSPNPWVEAFYADHTFEVDLLAAGNADTICAVAGDLYSREAVLKKVAAAIRHVDLAVSGRQVVRLANAVGKGWFSLLLTEKLGVGTPVPSHILDAVAFAAADSLTDEVLKRMGLYRIAKHALNDDARAGLPDQDELDKMPPAQFVDLFVKTAPDDTLAALIALLQETIAV